MDVFLKLLKGLGPFFGWGNVFTKKSEKLVSERNGPKHEHNGVDPEEVGAGIVAGVKNEVPEGTADWGQTV